MSSRRGVDGAVFAYRLIIFGFLCFVAGAYLSALRCSPDRNFRTDYQIEMLRKELEEIRERLDALQNFSPKP